MSYRVTHSIERKGKGEQESTVSDILSHKCQMCVWRAIIYPSHSLEGENFPSNIRYSHLYRITCLFASLCSLMSIVTRQEEMKPVEMREVATRDRLLEFYGLSARYSLSIS